jgi:adenylyl cyclase-associated protein
MVTTMAKRPEPLSAPFMDLVKDTDMKMLAVDDARQKHRGSPVKDHLNMVADGSGTLAWITVSSKPADMIAELFGGAQMYGNKLLREFRGK